MDKNIIENRLINEKNGIYSILSDSYDGWNKAHDFICNVHNEYFSCTPKELFSNHSKKICKKCYEIKKQKKKEEELEKKDKEFKEKLYNKFNGTIITNDKYTDKRCKINCQCLICGYSWPTTPESVLYNNGCKSCSAKKSSTVRLTTEIVQNRLNEMYGYPKYILQEEFITADTPIKILHTDCGNVTETAPKNVLYKERKYCKKCANFNKDIPFEDEVKELAPDYILLDEYKTNKIHVTMLHLTCGTKFPVTPNDFLNKHSRCPVCGGTKNKTFEEFKSQVESIKNGRFSLLSNFYTNNDDIYEFYDNLNNEKITKSAKEFLMKYSDVKLGKEGNGLSEEEFLEKIYSIPTNKEFILNEHYLNSNHPISYKHTCGEIIKYSTSRSDQVIICPKCHGKYSVGETQIINFLEKNNIKYIKEKTFNDCIYIKKLRFDFYINEEKLLIEFDGEQHFKGWNNDLEIIQKRDNIKNEWVKNHKEYKLIRIKYDQDINYILNEIFINNNYKINNLFSINIK